VGGLNLPPKRLRRYPCAAVALTIRSAPDDTAQVPTHSPCSGQALKVGATLAWLRLEPGNLKTFAGPRPPMRGAVEKPPAIKIGGLESEPCATFSLARLPMRRCGLTIASLPLDSKARI